MQLALRFWTKLMMWTGILFLILITVSLVGGQSVGTVMAHIPVWGGLALVLAAFPAGLAVSEETVPDAETGVGAGAGAGVGVIVRPIIHMTLAAIVVSLFTFVLAGWVGPAAVGWLNRDAPPTATVEPAQMPLHVLRTELRAAMATAKADSVTEPILRWRTANQLGWEYFSRVDGSTLPVLFGWIGVLLGFWSRLSSRSDFRQAQHWAMGVFLVVVTYLAGENGYEMVMLHSGRFAGFAADFRLIVPGALVIGLGWPTIMTLWKRYQDAAHT